MNPLIVETIRSTEKHDVTPVFEKQVYNSIPVPDGHIRVIVLIDHKGMLDDLYTGDVVDLPERRFKSLSFRGMVKEYKGNRVPNKQR